MNAYTTLSAKGQVVIPADMRQRLKLRPGMRLEISDKGGEIKLKPVEQNSRFPRTTTADLDRLPRWPGPPKSVEEISSLSDEAIRRIYAEREKNARA